MRRTDEQFKAEVFRRCEEFRSRRRKRRKVIAVICLPVLLCTGLWMMIFSSGFGGSTEAAFDSAMNQECAEEPAAAAPEEAEGGENQKMSGSSNGFGDTSVCNAVVLSIQVTSQPEMEEYSRVFTDDEKMYAIVDAIQAFYDDPQTTPGGREIGDCEGMGFRIVVTEETITREYTLFNNALSTDGEGEWLVNPACYSTLEQLIQQEDD